MRKTLRTIVLIAATAPMLAGCQSVFGRMFARHARPADASLADAGFNRDLAAGKQALAAGQFATAIASLRLARFDPASEAEAVNGLGVAYTAIGRHDLAERYFRQAVALAPQDARFAANLVRFLRARQADAALALRARQAALASAAPPELRGAVSASAGGGNHAVSASAPVVTRAITVSMPSRDRLVRVSAEEVRIGGEGAPVRVSAPARIAVREPVAAAAAPALLQTRVAMAGGPRLHSVVRDQPYAED